MQGLLVLAILLAAGCVPANGNYRDEGRAGGIHSGDHWGPPREAFIRVRLQKGTCPFVLERATDPTRVFDAAWLKLYGDVKHGMPVMRLGALPANTGVFTLWNGTKPSTSSDFLEARIPLAGGPWRGLVAELCDGVRYRSTFWHEVPGQPIGVRPVTTEVLHCSTSNVLTCIPWRDAVIRGLVRCEDRAGSSISSEWCVAFVPYTWWSIKEESR